MVELVDTRDLKSLGQEWLCGFESRSRHHTNRLAMSLSPLLSLIRISKRHSHVFLTVIAVALTAVLSSCGGKSGYFKIEGKFLNMNQGEFYVYSLDEVTDGIDTIKVNGGRFSYQIPCEHEATLMLVFPNFSEQPIFAESGGVAEMKADASHLKEMEVTGTDDNELMTRFRQQTVSASPPEIQKYAETFIEDHPESAVSVYLLRKYFIISDKPDFKKAEKMVTALLEKQEKNGMLNRLRQELKTLGAVSAGSTLPTFTAIDSNTVNDSYLREGKAIIYLWASWKYESKELMKQIKKAVRRTGGNLKVLSISVDAIKKECTEQLEHDTITWHNICDEQMFEGPLVKKLGLTSLPDNILLDNGRITDRGLTPAELRTRLEEMGK